MSSPTRRARDRKPSTWSSPARPSFYLAYRAQDAPQIRIPKKMMILRSSPPSPFGRKVKLALGILGLESDVTTDKADPTDASDSLRQQNPLGKIPALIIEDGTVLYDSPVILEYLDTRAGGGKIIPGEPDARLAALTLQALCDGILDAGILLVYEGRWRPPEMAVQKWIAHQRGKVERALA